MISDWAGDSSVTNKEQLELLDGLLMSADTGICVTDSEGRFTLVNPAYCRTYGYSPEELIGEPLTKVLAADQRKHAGVLHDAFIAGSPESSIERDIVHKNGSTRRILQTSGRVILEGGRRYKVTTVSDVTDIGRTVREFDAISRVLEQTSYGVIVTDVAGKTTWVNQATVDMTGFSLEELYGQKPGNLFQGEDTDPAVVRHMSQQLEAGNGFQVEVLNYTKSGERYTLHVSCSPVLDSSGTLQGYMALQTDITAKKESERRIAQSAAQAQRLGIAIDKSPVSVVITDHHGKIVFVTRPASTIQVTRARSLKARTPGSSSPKARKSAFTRIFGAPSTPAGPGKAVWSMSGKTALNTSSGPQSAPISGTTTKWFATSPSSKTSPNKNN